MIIGVILCLQYYTYSKLVGSARGHFSPLPVWCYFLQILEHSIQSLLLSVWRLRIQLPFLNRLDCQDAPDSFIHQSVGGIHHAVACAVQSSMTRGNETYVMYLIVIPQCGVIYQYNYCTWEKVMVMGFIPRASSTEQSLHDGFLRAGCWTTAWNHSHSHRDLPNVAGWTTCGPHDHCTFLLKKM